MKEKKHRVVLHNRSHLDEYAGAFVLFCYGEASRPGLEDAEVVFIDDAEYAKDPQSGDILIGLGGEDPEIAKIVEAVFDEHRRDGRLPDTCAAILVAECLKVAKKPELKKFLAEVLFCDTQPNVRPSQLANMVKAMHRVKGGRDQDGTYEWTVAACRAIVDGQVDQRRDIRKAWDLYCEENGVSEEVEEYIFRNFIHPSFGRRKSLVTELANIYACFENDRGRARWIQDIFKVLVADYQLFLAGIEELNTKSQVAEVVINGVSEPVAFVTSDNESLSRAVTSTKTGAAALLVVRDTNGLTQVHLNPRKGADLVNLAKMVRMAEYTKRTGKKLPRAQAEGNGAAEVCPNWYLANPNTLLNGSLTHRSVEPSVLTMEELKPIVLHAFSEAATEDWFDHYYVGTPLAATT